MQFKLLAERISCMTSRSCSCAERHLDLSSSLSPTVSYMMSFALMSFTPTSQKHNATCVTVHTVLQTDVALYQKENISEY